MPRVLLLVLNERLEFVGNRASAIAKTKGAQYGRGPHSDFEISARDVEEHRVRVASLEKKRGRHLITKIYPGPSLDGVQAMEPRAFGGMGIEADVKQATQHPSAVQDNQSHTRRTAGGLANCNPGKQPHAQLARVRQRYPWTHECWQAGKTEEHFGATVPKPNSSLETALNDRIDEETIEGGAQERWSLEQSKRVSSGQAPRRFNVPAPRRHGQSNPRGWIEYGREKWWKV
ncbi:hypothetical protein LTR38_000758 [Friedmanniomyces endolithicus]|nr:hypothetical protein LTR38_000758 [Friedmanniomyces endolithicus]